MRTSAGRFEKLVVALEGSHAEVGYLDVAILVEKQILRLQVAMTYVEPVAVVDSGDSV